MRRRECRWYLFPGRTVYHADRAPKTGAPAFVAECGRGLWGAEEVPHPLEREVCPGCAVVVRAKAPPVLEGPAHA